MKINRLFAFWAIAIALFVCFQSPTLAANLTQKESTTATVAPQATTVASTGDRTDVTDSSGNLGRSQSVTQRCKFQENTGKVSRIYPHVSSGGGFSAGTYLSLKGGTTNALTSSTGYYHLETSPTSDPATQSVYQAMHNLIVEAAKNNWTVQVRVRDSDPACTTNTPQATVKVEYLVVDP